MSSNSNTNNQDATATKRKRSDGSVKKSSEEKRKERLIANRRAAYNCRMRKRILIEELQRQVVELTRKNIAAEEENARLRVAMDMKPLEHGDGQQEVLLESSTVSWHPTDKLEECSTFPSLCLCCNNVTVRYSLVLFHDVHHTHQF